MGHPRPYTLELPTAVLTASQLKITADRDHDRVRIKLPCGESRYFSRIELDALVTRLKEAQTWLRPSSSPNIKEF